MPSTLEGGIEEQGKKKKGLCLLKVHSVAALMLLA